jgi:hypothetical protein
VLGAFVLFLISRLHEGAVAVVDRFFNRSLDVSQAMREAQEPADIDRLLADEPWRALKLSSAAAFRRQGSCLVRDEDGKGWEDCATRELNLEQPMLAPVSAGQPFGLKEHDDDGIDFPPGLRRPVLAVPAADPVRCFALSLYGPHSVGTDLDANERAMLSRLACFASAMYAELEAVELRHRIATLERKFKSPSRRLR